MNQIEEKVIEQEKEPKKEASNAAYDAYEDDEDDHLKVIELRDKKWEEEQKRLMNQPGAVIEVIEYDEHDNPIIRKRTIEPLPPVDHSKRQYPPFEKNVYDEHESIASMSENDVVKYRKSLGIHVHGKSPLRPVETFEQFGFDTALMNAIKKNGYESPTPIQCQAVPIALSGRDIIGIAKTGSGKTAAFVWPIVCHLKEQLKEDDYQGPRAVILAPARELATQIYTEAKKFCRIYGLKATLVVGGLHKGEQIKMLKESNDIIVSTPGRLIDMIKTKYLTLEHVTMLVLDEADRMFDMGFEPQIRSVVGQIRPDRQTLMFSATFKKTIEQLAWDILTDPIRITVGTIGMANEDIEQIFMVVEGEAKKWEWFAQNIQSLLSKGSVLVFGSTKGSVEELVKKIDENLTVRAGALHGDKSPNERAALMTAFKNGEIPILVATDIVSRGLDIKFIKTVINYHLPKDVQNYVHRIGRTGRAGDQEGTAYTFLTKEESHFASLLVKNLESSNHYIPDELLSLALKNPKFASERGKRHQRKRRGIGSQVPTIQTKLAEGSIGPQGYVDPTLKRESTRRDDQEMTPYTGFRNDSKVHHPQSNLQKAYLSRFVKSKEVNDSASQIMPTKIKVEDAYDPDNPTEEYDPDDPTD